MSLFRHHLSQATSRLLRAAVAVSITALLSFALVQRLPNVDRWWIELWRYLPYPVLLVVALLALALSARLGARWLLASGAALALVAAVSMGLVWGRPDRGSEPLRVMTYNIKAYKAATRSGGFAALAREVASQHPDVLLVQDNQGVPNFRSGPIWPEGRAFGFPHVFAVGQYIVASRYPLLDCAPREGAGGGAVYSHARCRVDVDGTVLNVVTTHFESPRTGLNAARREGFDGVQEWRQNYQERLGQARALARDLDGIARPVVVAGDLNAPEASPVVGALLRTGLRDAYSSAGRGYGYSYGHALRIGVSFLRIDHVLVSPEIGVANAFVGGSQASEHRPVIVDLWLRRR